MATTPATYPLMTLVNGNDEELVTYIPVAVIHRDNEKYPFTMVYDNMGGYILAVVDEAVLTLEAENRLQEDEGFTYTRQQVLSIYCKTASALIRNFRCGETERFIMDLADTYMSRMVEDEARASGNPIQYVKSLAAETRYPMVWDYLDRLLEDYASTQFTNKKAQVIQKYFRRVISDPYHDMCKRRLMYEFHNMTS